MDGIIISGLTRRSFFAFWILGLGVVFMSWSLSWREIASSSRPYSREPRGLCFTFPSQRRFCRIVNSSSCGCKKERDGPPILGSCSPRRSVRLFRSSTFNTSGGYATDSRTTGSAEVEGAGEGGANPGGLDHFPGAPRGGTRETDGFGLRPRLGGRDVCGSRLGGKGLFWLPVLGGGFCDSGFAHFEIGGAHLPRPAGVDVANGDGGAVDLLLEISHPLVCALTCAKQCVSIRSDGACW